MPTKQQTSVQIVTLDQPTYKSVLKSNAFIKSKTNMEFKEIYQSINKRGKAKFKSFYNKGKKSYVDGLPNCMVQSSNTKWNINDTDEDNITAFLNSSNGVNDITSSNIKTRITKFTDKVFYLLQDVNNIINNTLPFIAVQNKLNSGYTYQYLPYDNKIVLTKNNISTEYTYVESTLWYVYSTEDEEGNTIYWQEHYDGYVDDGFDNSNEVTSVTPLTEEEYYNMLSEEGDVTFTFQHGVLSDPDYEILSFNMPYNTTLSLTGSYINNSDTSLNTVLYKNNNIQKLELFSTPTYNTITYNNKLYKLFNDKWNTFTTYPIVMLRFRTYNLYSIYKEHKNEMKALDWGIEGCTGIFTPRRYKTANKLLKTLDFKLKSLTENFIYKEGKEKEGPAEGIDKTTSLFLFLGIKLDGLEDKLNGETITRDNGKTITLKPDKNAQIIPKVIFETLEEITNPATNEDSIVILIKESMYEYSVGFKVTRTIENVTSNKIPYYKFKRIKFTPESSEYQVNGFEVTRVGKTKTVTYKVSNSTGNTQVYHELTLNDQGDKDPTNDVITNLQGHEADGHTWFAYDSQSSLGHLEADLYFPLLKEVVSKLSIQDQCKLYAYCIQVHIMISYRAKLKWYQERTAAIIIQSLTLVLAVIGMATAVMRMDPKSIVSIIKTVILIIATLIMPVIMDSKMSYKHKSMFGLALTIMAILQIDFKAFTQNLTQNSIALANSAMQLANNVLDLTVGSDIEEQRKSLQNKLEWLKEKQKEIDSKFEIQKDYRYARNLLLNVTPDATYKMNYLQYDYSSLYDNWIENYCTNSSMLWLGNK